MANISQEGLTQCLGHMPSCKDVVLSGLPEMLQTIGPLGSDPTLPMFTDVVLSLWGLYNEYD